MADELIQAAGIFEGMTWWTSNNINPVNKSFFSDPLPCSLAGGEIGWSNHHDHLMFGGNTNYNKAGTRTSGGYYNEDDPLGYLSSLTDVIEKSDHHPVVEYSSVQNWSTTHQEAPVVDTGEANYYIGGGNCNGNMTTTTTTTGSAGGDSSNSSGEGSTITTCDHHQGSAGPTASIPLDDHSPSNLFQTFINNEQLFNPQAMINYQQMINSPSWSEEVAATNNKFSGKATLAASLEDIRASLFSSPSPSPRPVQRRPAGFDGDKPCQGDQRKEKGVNIKAVSSKNSSNVEPSIKRPRIETPSSLPTFKVRKEKLGDRITALQQLVSPFGKTDTASVLHEAIEYIKFLHDQVNVLSTSYMKNAAPIQHSNHQQGHNNSKNQDDLRSRGLCLVPISSTFPVAHETPADFWTPTFGATFR